MIQEDLAKMGYTFEHQKLDSRYYLLRQRRNRVWGSAARNVDETYKENLQATVHAMSSTWQFKYNDVFDSSLEQSNELHERVRTHLETAHLKATLSGESDDVFLDCSTSAGRRPEFCIGSTPCIRPTHAIYSYRLQRHLSVRELWLCQGLFPQDFPNAAYVEEVIENEPALAQCLAGNSFSSTVAQAKLLAALCHANIFPSSPPTKRHRGKQAQKRQAELPCSEPQVSSKAPKLDGSAGIPPPCKKIRRAKSIVAWDHSDAMSVASDMSIAPSVSIASSIAPSIAMSMGSKATNATGATGRDGKANSISVMEKLKICRRYDELKARGDIKNVEAYMIKKEKHRGMYSGCMSQKKWLGSRIKQKWDLFAEQCPDQAKICKEVPNVFRQALGVGATWQQTTYIYIYTCIYIYTYTHLYTHTYIYTYIHTYNTIQYNTIPYNTIQ